MGVPLKSTYAAQVVIRPFNFAQGNRAQHAGVVPFATLRD